MKLFIVFILCLYTFWNNDFSVSGADVECKDSKDLIPKDGDDKMRLIFEILNVEARVDADENPCDSPVDGEENPCDPYLIFKIDGKQIYQTKVYNSISYDLYEKIETGPVSKNSTFTFEMWDSDEGHSHDDLMSVWSGNENYYYQTPYHGDKRNAIRVGKQNVRAEKPDDTLLSFNIKGGEAWFDADSTTCDSPVDGKPNLCDPYVVVKIDGKEVYRTKAQDDTDHPIFNETFETGVINRYSFIEFEMWDSDVGFSPDDPMSTWSGYAQYFLTYDSFVGNVTDDKGIHRNSLSVSTKEVEPKKSDEIVKLFFNIADGKHDYTHNCDPCNSYVIASINGKEVYRTKIQNETNHPIYNEAFQTGWISIDSVIEFAMKGNYEKYSDLVISKWSGYPVCYLDHLRLTASSNSLIVSTTLLDRKHSQDIQLSFKIADARAWFKADSTPCDPRDDGRYDPCDSYIVVKINDKIVHISAQKMDTNHAIFNEIFETGWISKDAVITFEMWDHDGYFYDEDTISDLMDTWSGSYEYYLAHDSLVGNATDGTIRNSLNVSTKLIKKPEDDLPELANEKAE